MKFDLRVPLIIVMVSFSCTSTFCMWALLSPIGTLDSSVEQTSPGVQVLNVSAVELLVCRVAWEGCCSEFAVSHSFSPGASDRSVTYLGCLQGTSGAYFVVVDLELCVRCCFGKMEACRLCFIGIWRQSPFTEIFYEACYVCKQY